MNIRDVLDQVRKLAPEQYQAAWDNSGIQVAGPPREVAKVGVSIDPTPEAVSRCMEWGAEAMVTHHPLYLDPVAPKADGPYLQALRAIVKADAWLYACHTSLDCAPDGPAQWLGRALELTDTRPLELTASFPPMEISFYMTEFMDDETADAWANRDGVWSVSQSESGEVRLVVEQDAWEGGFKAAVNQGAGQRTDFFIRHLEKPAFEVGFGQAGKLPKRIPWSEFEAKIAAIFPGLTWRLIGEPLDTVRRVAYNPGSGGSFVRQAFEAGAEVYVTGDIKYHQALEAAGPVLDVGHFPVEEEMMRLFSIDLSDALEGAGVEVRFFPGKDPFAFRGGK